MRHNKKFNHLGRKADHRKAMLANMAISLIMHKRITTTVPKAKALRVYVEPIINRAKDDSTHSRRVVFSYLQNKYAIQELFGPVAEKIANRPGGYTRIVKLGARQGDAAPVCFIELVDFDENMAKTPKAAAKKTRRSRKSNKAEAPAAAVSRARLRLLPLRLLRLLRLPPLSKTSLSFPRDSLIEAAWFVRAASFAYIGFPLSLCRDFPLAVLFLLVNFTPEKRTVRNFSGLSGVVCHLILLYLRNIKTIQS